MYNGLQESLPFAHILTLSADDQTEWQNNPNLTDLRRMGKRTLNAMW